MRLLSATLFVGLGLTLVSFADAKVKYFKFEFNYDLEGMTTTGDGWRWADDAALGWHLPEGGGDYAALTRPGPPDQLFADFVPGYYGLNYTIVYYANEGSYGGTKMALNKVNSAGEVLGVIEDLSPENIEADYGWKTRIGYLHPGEDVLVSVSCQTAESNPDQTDFLWGCAVDTLAFITGDLPDISTPAPPSGEVDFDFEADTSGWTLGHTNGARWARAGLEESLVSQDYGLFLSRTDMHQGTVMAASPKLVAGSGGVQVTVAAMSAQPSDGMLLTLRVHYTYSSFEDEGVLLLQGEIGTGGWVNATANLPSLPSNREFYLTLEGNIGVKDDNALWVDYVTVSGASLGVQPVETLFDLSGGLPGWTIGAADGGLWDIEAFGNLQDVNGLPEPTNNSSGLLLYVNRDPRFWAFSGIISIESPLVSIEPSTSVKVMVSSWAKSGGAYENCLRVRVKKEDGTYLSPPGTLQGGVEGWADEGFGFTTPGGANASYQFALEADLGKSRDSFIAVQGVTVQLGAV